MKNIAASTYSDPESIFPKKDLITLSAFSHSALLQSTRDLVREERRITALVLSHLEEIERRRLHLESHSSLFDFCRRELGYSENEANARISAMRLSKAVPEVIAKVESGELSLTNLVKAQSFFRQEAKLGKPVSQTGKRDLLGELEGKSTRECERILAVLSPIEAPADRVRVLSATQTEIIFAADQSLMTDLEKIRALWGHQGPFTYAELFQKMAGVVLFKKDPARDTTRSPQDPAPKPIKAIKSPGAPQVNTVKWVKTVGQFNTVGQVNVIDHASTPEPDAPPPEFVTPATRHIPAETRRAVWQRDRGQCTHQYAATRKPCGSTFALELDHIIPWAHGGTHQSDNLRLLCRAHHGLRTHC